MNDRGLANIPFSGSPLLVSADRVRFPELILWQSLSATTSLPDSRPMDLLIAPSATRDDCGLLPKSNDQGSVGVSIDFCQAREGLEARGPAAHLHTLLSVSTSAFTEMCARSRSAENGTWWIRCASMDTTRPFREQLLVNDS